MKKVLALVLALVMTLTVVSAMAGESPTPKKKTTGGDTVTEINVPDAKDNDGTIAIKEDVKKAEDAGDGLTVITGVDVPASATIVEMVTVKFPTGAKILTFARKFQTPFTPGETVIILIGIPGNPVEWVEVKGVANSKGEVVFSISQAIYDKIAGKEVVMIAVKESK